MTNETTVPERSAFKAYVLPVLMLFSVISFISWICVRVHAEAVFEENVESRLLTAAHSINPVEADQDLNFAINYLEANSMDRGYTSVFYRTEDENLSKWVGQLREVKKFVSAPQKDPSTAFIALNTVLTDCGKSDRLYIPTGISIAGHNKLYFWWSVLSLLLGLGVFVFAVNNDRWDLNPKERRGW